jgi:hypothetical protein
MGSFATLPRGFGLRLGVPSDLPAETAKPKGQIQQTAPQAPPKSFTNRPARFEAQLPKIGANRFGDPLTLAKRGD